MNKLWIAFEISNDFYHDIVRFISYLQSDLLDFDSSLDETSNHCFLIYEDANKEKIAVTHIKAPDETGKLVFVPFTEYKKKAIHSKFAYIEIGSDFLNTLEEVKLFEDMIKNEFVTRPYSIVRAMMGFQLEHSIAHDETLSIKNILKNSIIDAMNSFVECFTNNVKYSKDEIFGKLVDLTSLLDNNVMNNNFSDGAAILNKEIQDPEKYKNGIYCSELCIEAVKRFCELTKKPLPAQFDIEIFKTEPAQSFMPYNIYDFMKEKNPLWVMTELK
jgi:hypothetical protein